MENKKPKRVKKEISPEGKIKSEPVNKAEFNKTLLALLKIPPPKKNKAY